MRIWVLGVAAFLAAGCGSSRVYLNRDVTTVLVLAPMDEHKGPEDASWKMWKYLEREVAHRGYRLVPHDKVAKFYTDKKYTANPGQIIEWSTKELAQHFSVDAVVWSRLTAWEATTLGIYNSVEVKIEAELQDSSGAVMWKGEGEDGYSQAPSRKGMLTSFVGAAVADPEKYAPGAAAGCFRGMPWAGWDPDAPRTPPEPPPAK